MNTHIPSLLNYDEARTAARRRLPRGVFEYIDRGTEGEFSLRENRDSLDRIRLVPRICVDVTKRDLSITLFGQPQAMPLVVSPTASLLAMFRPLSFLVLTFGWFVCGLLHSLASLGRTWAPQLERPASLHN